MSMKTCLPSAGSSLGPCWPRNTGWLDHRSYWVSLDLSLTELHFDTYCFSDICALWRKWNQPDVEGAGRCNLLKFLVDPCQTASQLKVQKTNYLNFTALVPLLTLFSQSTALFTVSRTAGWGRFPAPSVSLWCQRAGAHRVLTGRPVCTHPLLGGPHFPPLSS